MCAALGARPATAFRQCYRTGEFVVNAHATARNRALLEAVNDNRLPAFADGGVVGDGTTPVFAKDNRPQIANLGTDYCEW
ncbi:hypothetical protein [Mesorhizobium sp. WSM3859]|uniref:hypothetical protein n=1 Tax=Mesorhizobium sp. WSM3859 TaxID=2029402 RepID=UPI001596B401|nr:hypothetical protein [Mesorhizobium sp. WSM3859]